MQAERARSGGAGSPRPAPQAQAAFRLRPPGARHRERRRGHPARAEGLARPPARGAEAQGVRGGQLVQPRVEEGLHRGGGHRAHRPRRLSPRERARGSGDRGSTSARARGPEAGASLGPMKAAMTHGAFLPFWEPLGDFQSLLRPLGWDLSIFGWPLSICGWDFSIFGWDLSIFCLGPFYLWLGPFYCWLGPFLGIWVCLGGGAEDREEEDMGGRREGGRTRGERGWERGWDLLSIFGWDLFYFFLAGTFSMFGTGPFYFLAGTFLLFGRHLSMFGWDLSMLGWDLSILGWE